MKLMWISCGVVMGLTSLSIAMGSVPSRSRSVTNDTAIYQKLSDIQVRREGAPDFDSDIARLSSAQGQYKEKLPALAKQARLKGAMQRIAQQEYRPTTAPKVVR